MKKRGKLTMSLPKIRTLATAALTIVLVSVPAALAFADPSIVLQPMEETKQLISDLAWYAKYLLPGLALAYLLWGSILKSIAGSDPHKQMKSEQTMANAKIGLVIGICAAPIALWLQAHYTH
jgi:hypothetical protein